MTTNTPTIAIIGAGNMGSALISGLITHQYPADQLWVCDPSLEKIESLQKKLGVAASTQNAAAVEKADVVVFAVKPQILPAVAKELAPLVQKHKPLIISIAAGITTENLQQWLGKKLALVRCMPNMPALLGCGASALYANQATAAAQRQLAESLFQAVGITVWLDKEKQMDAVTALSGSGPAYFFLILEALQQAGQKLGLSEEMARLLTLHTAYGATCLVVESEEDIATLRQRVTSPGGTTESALQVLEKGDLRGLIEKALRAACKRSEELSYKKESP